MKPTDEYKSSIIELINKAKKYSNNLGKYKEHFINENFDYSVRLDNNTGVKISRIVVQDFKNQPSSLEEEDLQEIANSVWNL